MVGSAAEVLQRHTHVIDELDQHLTKWWKNNTTGLDMRVAGGSQCAVLVLLTRTLKKNRPPLQIVNTILDGNLKEIVFPFNYVSLRFLTVTKHKLIIWFPMLREQHISILGYSCHSTQCNVVHSVHIQAPMPSLVMCLLSFCNQIIFVGV